MKVYPEVIELRIATDERVSGNSFQLPVGTTIIQAKDIVERITKEGFWLSEFIEEFTDVTRGDTYIPAHNIKSCSLQFRTSSKTFEATQCTPLEKT